MSEPDIVEALAREVGRTGKLLHSLGGAQWSADTRCPPMTVMDLVSHMYRGAVRIRELIDRPADAEPEKDAVTYFRYDADEEAPVIVSRAKEVAAGFTPATLVRAWDTEWSKALRSARAAGDPVGPTVFGLMRLAEYLRTRILEVVVHTMDVRDALGRSPDPDPVALAITGDVLRGLLGTDLRGTRMDDVRFTLTGTGRAQLDDAERSFLGPLADRFPLLR